MPAYILIKIATEDPAMLKEYQARAPAIIEQYGGRFLVRGGTTATLEGPEESRRLVLIEFPDLPAAKRFYHSPEYSAARQLRAGVATAEIVALEGVA